MRQLLLFLIASIITLLLASCASNTSSRHAVSSTPVQNIALLTPLTGPLAPYGNAIRNGFFTSYYTQKEATGYSPTITVYDTGDQSTSVQALYQKATQAGADFIVGPLDKASVRTLVGIQSLAVPVLALNTTDDGSTNPNVYQFSLSPLDEAMQAAIKIASDSHKKVIIFAPDTENGKRLVSVFVEQWKKMHGTVVAIRYYSNTSSISQIVGDALNVNQGADDTKSLDHLLHRNLRYIPSRRQDFDSVFMVSTPSVARQIVPLLRYYFAGSIPVYATSQVNDNKSDSDLTGVTFSDIPWVLAPEKMSPALSEMQKRIQTLWPNVYQRYARFYALGIDAYLLTMNFHRLESGESIAGATGTLSLDNQHITHELWWAKIGEQEQAS